MFFLFLPVVIRPGRSCEHCWWMLWEHTRTHQVSHSYFTRRCYIENHSRCTNITLCISTPHARYVHTSCTSRALLMQRASAKGITYHAINSYLKSWCTVFALTYGTAKNSCIGNHSALIRMC